MDVFEIQLQPFVEQGECGELRAMSWTYFKVFEPLGLALWSSHDPLACLERMGGWQCERMTCCLGNFQVITATRL